MSTQTSDQGVVRQAERARMWRALDALAGGSPGVLQLAGEAGIGKSYLLSEHGARSSA
jgi:predicted ATPase